MTNYEPRKNKKQLMEWPLRRVETEGLDLWGSKLIARNTVSYCTGNKTTGESAAVIRYHRTDVLTVYRSTKPGKGFNKLKRVVVDCGGFLTMTSKDRVNIGFHLAGLIGWNIHSLSGLFFVRTPAGTFPHVDGAEYRPDGKPAKPGLHKNLEAQKLRDSKLVKDFIRKMKREGLPSDGAGDAIIFDWKPVSVGREVALDWLEGGYIQLSHMIHILRLGGLQDAGIQYWLSCFQRDRKEDIFTKRVRRWFMAALGYGV